jgi:lipoate-protein ligase A
MHMIDNQSYRDPALNLALEEFLMGRFRGGETVLLFYINDPAVVIGRNQIPYVEVNLQQAQQQQVAVVRRISGGGAVYHGPGNLNFSLIQARGAEPFPSPGDAVRPVLASLKALGLPACLNARHDILLDGMKVTGTAQYRAQGKCLTHGTLLVSADLGRLQRLLTCDSDVPFFRGRGSVRSPVTNLTNFRPGLTTAEVRAALIQSFAAFHGRATSVALSPADWSAIRNLAQVKYRSWDWAVGRSPEFSIFRRARLSWGWCDALIRIRRGIVTQLDLTAPDTAPPVLAKLATNLVGCRYHPDAVAQAVQAVGLAQEVLAMSDPVANWLCASFCWWR